MKKSHAIVSMLMLTVLLTAGAAQSLSGSNTVFTDDIVDGQVKYSDIANGALTGTKILDNSVVGADIDDSTLRMESAEAEDSTCNADAGVEDCASAPLNLSRAGKVWIVGTYEWDGNDAAGTAVEGGTIKLVVDGTTVEQFTIEDTGDDTQYPMPVQELVNLDAGAHTIKMTFQEVNAAADVDIKQTHIVAVRLGLQD